MNFTRRSFNPCIGFGQAPEHVDMKKEEGRAQDIADDCFLLNWKYKDEEYIDEIKTILRIELS
jgi:hypothetical protein